MGCRASLALKLFHRRRSADNIVFISQQLLLWNMLESAVVGRSNTHVQDSQGRTRAKRLSIKYIKYKCFLINVYDVHIIKIITINNF